MSSPARSPSQTYGAAALLLASAGCATVQDCDPRRDPGFFGVIGCHASGSFHTRVKGLESTVEEERKKHEQLERKRAASLAKQHKIRAELERKQRELKDLDLRMAALDAEVATSKKKNAALQSRISQAKEKLQRLKQATQAQQDQAGDLERLKKQIKALEEALKAAS